MGSIENSCVSTVFSHIIYIYEVLPEFWKPCQLDKWIIVLVNLMNKLKVVLLSHLMKFADNWYLVAAALATIVSVKVPRINAKAVAPYYYTVALWAVCIFQRMTWNISKVCVGQALLLCYLIVFFKCFNRCIVKLQHFVVRVEPEKMYWCIRAQLIVHELA